MKKGGGIAAVIVLAVLGLVGICAAVMMLFMGALMLAPISFPLISPRVYLWARDINNISPPQGTVVLDSTLEKFNGTPWGSGNYDGLTFGCCVVVESDLSEQQLQQYYDEQLPAVSERYSGRATNVQVLSAASFDEYLANSSYEEEGSFYQVHASAAFAEYGRENIYLLMFHKWGRTEFFN